MAKNILQCDSRGDKRFSPLFCQVQAFGVTETIEDHYQKAKVFIGLGGEIVHPKDWKDAKSLQKPPPYGKGLTLHFQIKLPNGWFAPRKFLIFGWYSSLWLKYLDLHPRLVEEAKLYDDYKDRFKHSFPLCQADCIRLYCKQGRGALLAHCQEFFDWIDKNREAR